MVQVGIDIGTDSVRVCGISQNEPVMLERGLERHQDGVCHTMSAVTLWDTVSSMVCDILIDNGGDKNGGEITSLANHGGLACMKNGTGTKTGANHGVNVTVGNVKDGTNADQSELGKRNISVNVSSRCTETVNAEIAQNTGASETDGTGHSAKVTFSQPSIPGNSAQQFGAKPAKLKSEPKTYSIQDGDGLNECHENELKHAQDESTICVAATCSMVVMEKVCVDGCNWYQAIEPGHEVIIWMDTRAKTQAAALTQSLPQDAVAQVGGKVTPAMGIAKLAWVAEKWGRAHNVAVFELFDWVSYVFLAGGMENGRVRCLEDDITEFGSGLRAMDGSVKGWDRAILDNIPAKVCAPKASIGITATSAGAVSNTGFEYVGTPLGKCPPGPFEGITVCHGCIDCYAGWAARAKRERDASLAAKTEIALLAAKSETGILTAKTKSGENSADRKITKTDKHQDEVDAANVEQGRKIEDGPSLLMVAGTLTCFIADCTMKDPQPIPGLWGPFTQLAPKTVFSFGQPATGQLFAELFAAHTHIIGSADPFEYVEARAKIIEATRGPLAVLARHYMYYGDRHGNRSPYGDFSMGEILVDGVNAGGEDNESNDTDPGTNDRDDNKEGGSGTTENATLPSLSLSLIHDNDPDTLVLKYYLTLEFLVFQTRQLCDELVRVFGPLRKVVVCGSQAKNHRFLSMLALAFGAARIEVGSDAKFAGAQGAAVAGSRRFAVAPALDTQVYEAGNLGGARILEQKFGFWRELAAWQARFRTAMA